MEGRKTNPFIERMKQRAVTQKNYGGTAKETTAQIEDAACLNCGAGRAKQDGLTLCAYCGHPFIQTTLSEGKYIKFADNSSK